MYGFCNVLLMGISVLVCLDIRCCIGDLILIFLGVLCRLSSFKYILFLDFVYFFKMFLIVCIDFFVSLFDCGCNGDDVIWLILNVFVNFLNFWYVNCGLLLFINMFIIL